jgi:hypothetical protein
MSPNPTIYPDQPLSASELVLLNGEKFAKKVMMGNIQLMHTDESVSVAQLGQAILAAGVLALEASGNLELEARQEKALFGLRKVTNLYANPRPQANEWPEACLESQFLQITGRLKTEVGNNQVSNILYAWLREDSGSPWQSAIERVKAGMAQRGLLEAYEEKSLKIFTVTRYTLPEGTKALAAQQSIHPVQQLLSNCENYRKDVWDLLIKQIKKAIKDRTEQDDVDFD